MLKSHGIMIDSHLWFDCHAKKVRSEGVQLPHMHAASRVHSVNRQLGSDNTVQYCQFQVGLLQQHTLRCTICDFRCAAASAEPRQGHLPAWRSNWRQTTSQVALLADSQALSDIQDGGADIQDDVLLNATILEWPDPDNNNSNAVIIVSCFGTVSCFAHLSNRAQMIGRGRSLKCVLCD